MIWGHHRNKVLFDYLLSHSATRMRTRTQYRDTGSLVILQIVNLNIAYSYIVAPLSKPII